MSRLTMQEVIDHCEKTAKRIEDNVKYCREWLKAEHRPLESKNYLEHKQTAEWLKELQRYKELEEAGKLIEVTRCRNCIRHENSSTTEGFGWCDEYERITADDGYCSCAVEKLAELKGGTE